MQSLGEFEAACEILLSCSSGGCRAPATHEVEVSATLVNGWKPPTNATKDFILDVEMGLFKCVSLKQLLKLIKDPLKLNYFFSY